MNKVVEMNKRYKYRNGAAARVLCTDRSRNRWPVISMSESGTLYFHNEDGSECLGLSYLDLVEIEPEDQPAGWRVSGDPIGETVNCPHCGDAHEVQYGFTRTRLSNGMWSEPVPCDQLGFYKCGEKIYLASVDGKKIKRVVG